VTTTAETTPQRGSFGGLSDLKLILRQVGYEQLSFWLNPIGAFFTIIFSTVFLLILEATAGHNTVSSLGGIKLIEYYVPGFVAYGIMSSCYNIQAITMVNRREMGLLKRLRLSPAPTSILMSAIFVSSMVIALIQVVLMLVLGRFVYGVHGPAHLVPFVLVVVVGMLGFTALGIGVSTLIPNADAAGPVSSIVFFILLALSGLWFPIPSTSAVAKVTDYFPVRHLILALEDSFNHIPGASPWAWHDLLVIALWGVGGVFVAVRRWEWSPRRG
jgi:ABC-2 type transport system permease protein